MASLLKNHPGTTLARYDHEPTAVLARVSGPPKTLVQSEPRVVNAFRYAVPMPTRAELLKEPMLPDDKNPDGSLKEFGEW